MPNSRAAQTFTTRHPEIQALQFDGSAESVQRLLGWGAPLYPDPTPDRGWMLECTALAEYHTELLYPGVWVTHNALGWDICEPDRFVRTFSRR